MPAATAEEYAARTGIARARRRGDLTEEARARSVHAEIMLAQQVRRTLAQYDLTAEQRARIAAELFGGSR